MSVIVKKSEMIPGSFQINTLNNLLTSWRVSAVDYHSINMLVTNCTYFTCRILFQIQISHFFIFRVDNITTPYSGVRRESSFDPEAGALVASFIVWVNPNIVQYLECFFDNIGSICAFKTVISFSYLQFESFVGEMIHMYEFGIHFICVGIMNVLATLKVFYHLMECDKISLKSPPKRNNRYGPASSGRRGGFWYLPKYPTYHRNCLVKERAKDTKNIKFSFFWRNYPSVLSLCPP